MQAYMCKSTKERLDKAAYAKACMLQGEFDWGKYGYKRPLKNGDGTIRTPATILLAEGGWSKNSNSMRPYLESDYFKERFAYHMQRLEKGFKQALAELTEGGDALKQMSGALFESLMADLSDPERSRKIPFRDRAMLYEKITELEAKLKGDAATKGQRSLGPSTTNVLAIMGNNMAPEQFQQMAGQLASVHEDVVDIVEGVVAVADSE